MEMVYNWHIIEKCNYSCHYCFAKWQDHEDKFLHEKQTFSILQGMLSRQQLWQTFDEPVDKVRVNFAGGEPLLLGKRFIKLVKQAKDLGLRTSIITNGSLLMRYMEVVQDLDMVGISIDSLDDSTNQKIGRCSGNKKCIDLDMLTTIIIEIRKTNPAVQVKLNVVVNKDNYREKIIPKLLTLRPQRIKVLRQLPFQQNKGISDVQFKRFLQLNAVEHHSVVIEDNLDMTQSYMMIDPKGRFFQNGRENTYQYSQPIHEVGFSKALKNMSFSPELFKKRYS